MRLIAHKCAPRTWCGMCSHNVKAGGEPNHPGNEIDPRPARVTRAPDRECANLGGVVRVAGSTREFRACKAGMGSRTTDARRGLVVVCSSCGGNEKNVWKLGRECGPSCERYEEPA